MAGQDVRGASSKSAQIPKGESLLYLMLEARRSCAMEQAHIAQQSMVKKCFFGGDVHEKPCEPRTNIHHGGDGAEALES